MTNFGIPNHIQLMNISQLRLKIQIKTYLKHHDIGSGPVYHIILKTDLSLTISAKGFLASTSRRIQWFTSI